MSELSNYAEVVGRLKQEIEAARLNTALTVNKQMLVLYWRIGIIILEQQDNEGWGTKVVERPSVDLKKAFPEMKGFSSRNLKYMRAFAEAYPVFVQDQLAQIPNDAIVQDPLAQITCYHITLLDKVPDEKARWFYIAKTAEHSWSRNVMVHQVESRLYERQGKAVTNFSNTLPSAQSDLAKEILKDPYKFDFLSLSEEYMEKDLEEALVNHITKFYWN
ncbi:MAG: hypothetical protein JWQ09_4373 [Segetibacter sp.]|nr:hypothetical protein [Segetibacter sp.]